MTLAPKDTHYHRSDTILLDVAVPNWVHPFVESLSDKIVETLPQGAAWIEQTLFGDSPTIKGISFIETAMRHYEEHQLEHDKPMQDLISSSENLQKRIYTFTSL